MFQYHKVQRTEAHEEMIKSHIETVLHHAPQITNVIIHTEMDHGDIEKLRLEAHMPQKKNFNGEVVVERGCTMDHAAVMLADKLENWIEHETSKLKDHGHQAGHAINKELEADD